MVFSELNITMICCLNQILFFLKSRVMNLRQTFIFRFYYGVTQKRAFHMINLTETVLPEKDLQVVQLNPE